MSITITDTLKFRESVNDDWQRLMIQANINFNLIYPVGSIYMSTVNTSPATLFGGTWEQLEDRFLLGAGTTYTAGDTGGEATHTLLEAEIPSHTHGVKANSSNSEASGYGLTQTGAFQNRVLVSRSSADMTSTSTGGGGAHNNMPPYIVVYMWKRLTLSPALTPLPLNVLGDVASEDIVPVAKGGTGADNAADAVTNLGINKIVYDSELSSASYTHTVTEEGMYLMIIRANASASNTNPIVKITTASQETQNNGATGGNVMAYQVASLPVGATITFEASNYTYTTGYEKFGRRTIIKLGSHT